MSIVHAQGVALDRSDTTWTETALVLGPGMGFDEWESLGYTLGRMEKAVQWWIGDWLNFGEREYGEKYAQAMESTGLDYQTVANYAWVSGKVSLRRESLSWSHHNVVAALEPDDQREALERAERDELTVRQLRDYVKRGDPVLTPPARIGTYSVLVADPPWRYENTSTRGAAEDHYGTMSLDELKALYPEHVPAADNAHLYLWVTNGMMREGFELCEAWGFQYKALLTWCKPQIGLGNYFRNATEHVIFGLRGRLPMNAKDIPTWFKASRTEHSRKPDSFYDLVEKASPGPYMEMFARRRRLGWDAWGNEA